MEQEKRRQIGIMWWGLMVPGVILCLGLRGWVLNMAFFGRGVDPVAPELLVRFVVDAMRTTAGTSVALGALIMAMIVAIDGRRVFHLTWVLSALVFVLFATVETAGGLFAVQTGAPLDLYVLWAAFAPSVWAMVAASTPTVFHLCGLAAAGVCFGGPIFLILRGPPEWVPGLGTKGWFGVSAAALLVAMIPPLGGPDARVAVVPSPTMMILKEAVSVPFRESRAVDRQAHTRASLVPVGDPKNVVIVILESTRHDATTPYNPSLGTTPNLQSIAEEGVVFERAFTVLPSTVKAIVATLCGVYPDPTVRFTSAGSGRIPQTCMPDLLEAVGYRSFYIEPVIGTFQFKNQVVVNVGFDDTRHLEDLETEGFEKINILGYEEGIMLEPIREFVTASDEPFILTALTLASHHEYTVPVDQIGNWNDDPLANQYLSAVHFVDQFVGSLRALLEEEGLWDDTVVLVLGDHGEGFGEHYAMGHNAVLYEEGVRIPVVLKAPGLGVGRNRSVVTQVDMFPTVLAAAGWGVEGGEYDGSPVGELDSERTVPLFCLFERQCIGALEWPYKYIHNFGIRADELYDLSLDPREKTNLATSKPELVERLRAFAAAEYIRVRTAHGAQRVTPILD